MKKWMAFIVAVLLMLTMSVPVCAADELVNLEELGVMLFIPDEYYILTRDMEEDDPSLEQLGITKEYVMELFQTSDIYLNAVSDTHNEEIVVTMVENDIDNFNDYDDDMLETLTASLVEQFAAYDMMITDYEIYEHLQAKFVKIYYNDSAESVHALQYYTVYDNMAMNFTMRSYEGSITDRQEEIIEDAVESVLFMTEPEPTMPIVETDAFTYKDKAANVRFTVPANWVEEDFTEGREYIDAKFVSTLEEGMAMIYGSTDMWEALSTAEKAGHTRAEVDDSMFSKADIAEMYQTTADHVSTVTYNGVTYYRCESEHTSESYGFQVTVTLVQLVYIENGWMYTFQFGGPSSHALYSDFESMVESVKYPAVEEEKENTQHKDFGESDADQGEKSAFDQYATVGAVVCVVGVAVLLIFLLSRKKKDTPNQTPPAPQPPVNHQQPPVNYQPMNPQPPVAPQPTKYCGNCGQAIPADSVFCPACGAKTEGGSWS